MPLLALAALLLACAAPARAAPGSTAANFLKVGVGARPVAMGEAYTALSDDVYGTYYNPAGLAFLERQELSMMHNQFFRGVLQEWAGYAYPAPYAGTFAGSFNILRVKPFDSYDVLDQKTGSVSAADMAGTVSYAYQLSKSRNLAFGVSGKVVQSRLASYSATSGAMDAGLLWGWGETGSWSAGMALRNVGPGMKFISEQFQLPASAHLAVAYRGSLAPLMTDAAYIFTAEGNAPRDHTPFAAAGFEFRPIEEFPIRFGWRQNQDAGIGLSAGIGFRSLEGGFVSEWFPELDLDYAFTDYGPLEMVHRVSLSFRFGLRKGELLEGAERKAPRFHYLIRD